MKDNFRIGNWAVEPQRLTLSNGREAVSIKPRSMAVLVELARAGGEVVARNDLLDRVWGDAEVTDDVLTQSIAELRRAFGDDARNPRYLETIKRVGIRLIPEVQTPAEDDRPRPAWRWAALSAAALVGLFVVLATIGPDQPLPADRSIAVLPFVNLTSNEDDTYFGDGLAEELLNSLMHVPALRVPARTSSFAYRDRSMDVREIGRRLNVAHVLEGSVRRSGGRIRVTAQLIDVDDGFHRWSRTYDYEWNDAFQIQQEIATDLAATLAIDLATGVTPDTTSGRAYELYLAGLHQCRSGRFEQAADLLQQAIGEDPQYALAHAQLAQCLTVFRETATGVLQVDQGLIDRGRLAREAVEEAFRLAPSEPQVFIARASIAAFEGRFDDERLALEQAIDMDPTSVEAHTRLSLNLSGTGEYARARRHLETAARLDPLNPELAVRHAALVALFEGYEPAAAEIRELVELDLGSPRLFDALVDLSADFGRYVERVDHARRLVRAAPDSAWARAQLGDAYTELGLFDLADEWIESAEALSRLEAFKSRARWFGATGRFPELHAFVTGTYQSLLASGENGIAGPARAPVLAITGIASMLNGEYERSARLFRQSFELSATLRRRPPHMPIYGGVMMARALHGAGDAVAFQAELEQAHRHIGQAATAGIVAYPWLTLTSAAVLELGGDHDAARAAFEAAVDQGWRAWNIESVGVAAPLADHADVVDRVLNDLERMRTDVVGRGMAESPDAFLTET